MIDKLIIEGTEYNVIQKYIFNSKDDITEDKINILKYKHNVEKAIIGNINNQFILILANIIQDVEIITEEKLNVTE